jgi:N-acetylneuraminic acid mutarotase
VEQLQQQLSQQSLKPPQPPPPSQAQVRGRQLQERESRKQLPVQPSLQVDHKPHPHRVRKMILNWRDGGKAPFKMNRGAAVVDGNVAYFMHWDGKVCSYNVSCKKWSKLPEYPYQFSSLAVVNGQVTAIGGCKEFVDKDTYTNKVLSLPGYKEVFPAMPTKRRGTTAVTSKDHLIVAGGSIGVDRLNTVEVMDTKKLIWSIVASLPHSYSNTSMTICGDQLNMLGGYDGNDRTKSVLTCSLTELLQSSSSSSIWHRVADAPACLSTCAAVNGELLAVGGCNKDVKPSSAVQKYDPITNSWDLISIMPTARWYSLVAVLPTNEIMVVGGSIKGRGGDIDTIEITDFTLS